MRSLNTSIPWILELYLIFYWEGIYVSRQHSVSLTLVFSIYVHPQFRTHFEKLSVPRTVYLAFYWKCFKIERCYVYNIFIIFSQQIIDG